MKAPVGLFFNTPRSEMSQCEATVNWFTNSRYCWPSALLVCWFAFNYYFWLTQKYANKIFASYFLARQSLCKTF